LNGNFNEVITNRKESTTDYKNYIEKRRTVNTKFFTVVDDKITAVDLT
jgi:hypothetical protein